MPHTLARDFGVDFTKMNIQALMDTARVRVADDKGLLAKETT